MYGHLTSGWVRVRVRVCFKIGTYVALLAL